MRKSFKFRIYPTSAQCFCIELTLNLCRFLYNCALEERRNFWIQLKKSVSFAGQCAYLSEIKLLLPEFKSVYSQVLQDTLKRLDKAFQAFFRRVKQGKNTGYPRFKNSDRFHSFTYPQSGFRIDTNRIFLSKIGHIKLIKHREITGKVKTCSITRSPSGKYFVCISTDDNPVKSVNKTAKEIGLDLGIKNYIMTSEKQIFENPKILKSHAKRLAKAQVKLDKKPKGMNARRRARKHVARIYEKITNCRVDHQHKISRKLVENYDVIYLEDLTVQSMTKNGHRYLNRSIMDCSWTRLGDMIVYKAEEAGKRVIFVDPAGTSQECSGCGKIITKELSERMHRCGCGLEIDRDLNAAINVLNRGRLITGPGRIGLDSRANGQEALTFR